jgi:hypothetical protein
MNDEYKNKEIFYSFGEYNMFHIYIRLDDTVYTGCIYDREDGEGVKISIDNHTSYEEHIKSNTYKHEITDIDKDEFTEKDYKKLYSVTSLFNIDFIISTVKQYIKNNQKLQEGIKLN